MAKRAYIWLLLFLALCAAAFALYFRSMSQQAAEAADLSGHLIISEVCPDNESILQDADGNCTDWVELYNPTEETVSLSGWSLSNKKRDLLRYTFPEDASIRPGEYLVVFCSKPHEEAEDSAASSGTDSSAAAEEEPQPEAEESGQSEAASAAGEYHAAFNLSRGDTVCLSQDGTVVDALTTPLTLQADTAYGRLDLSSEPSVLSATPGESNADAAELALVEQPVFSQESGFYDESFTLTITAPEGCTIYYTTDSSSPTTESTRYTGPITIEDATPSANKYSLNTDMALWKDSSVGGQEALENGYYCAYLLPEENLDKCTVIRAIAVDADGNRSDVTTASYFVGFGDRAGYENVSVISLVSDPEDLFGAEKGILVSGETYAQSLADGSITLNTYWGNLKNVVNFFRSGLDWEREVHLDYFESGQTLSFSQEAGIRTHGNASLKQVQKGFSLFARSGYDGNSQFLGSFFGNGLTTDKVFLVNGTAIRKYFLISQMDDRTMDTEDYRLVQVFLDGEYWGLYAFQEAYNSDTYTEDHYGVDSDDVVLLGTGSQDLDLISGEEGDKETYYEPLVEYASSHDLSQPEYYSEISQMMDIQSFIDYCAANLYLVNVDWNWHQNIYLFYSKDTSASNPYADGRWHWMLYDLDYSSAGNSQTPASTNTFTDPRPFTKWNLLNDPFFQYLMENDTFRAQFVRTFMDLANYVYEPERMEDQLEVLRDTYREAAYLSVLRYPKSDDSETLNADTHASRFTTACDGLAEFFEDRQEIAIEDLAEFWGLTGSLATITIENQTPEGGTVSINTITPELDSENRWSGKYYTDCSVVLTATPAEGYVFGGWTTSGGTLSAEADVSAELTFTGNATVSAVFLPVEESEE